MKRDLELIRKILIEMEADDSNPLATVKLDIPGYDPEFIAYHVEMLSEIGMIVAVSAHTTQRFRMLPQRLTFQGHEFLDTIKAESRWDPIKQKVNEVSGWTLGTVAALGSEYLKRQMGL